MALSNCTGKNTYNVPNNDERNTEHEAMVKASRLSFENRSKPVNSPLTRRRNLSTHLGVDESVSKEELEMINMSALPRPSSSQASSNSSFG